MPTLWEILNPVMHECSNGELFARAAFMHHDDHGHYALRHAAVLKGLMVIRFKAQHVALDERTMWSIGYAKT